MMQIPESCFDFLNALSSNNNREWFNANKESYLNVHAALVDFTDKLQEKMCMHDYLDISPNKKSLYRIYADTRFSKDKTPYKTHFGGRFKRATKKLRGGYYYHIEPGNNYVAGGFFAPNPADLKRIRQDIEMNLPSWNKILGSKQFKNTFGIIRGEKLNTVPKGFSKEDEGIDLLRHKQFIIRHDFSDEEVLSKDFLNQMNDTFKKMRPFFDYMSEVLTTDLNGEAIV